MLLIPGELKKRYDEWAQKKREPFLRRAREASALTLPTLIPPESHTGENDLPSPYQNMGSRGVNNIASKLLLIMFPPNQPFFRMVINDYDTQKETDGNPDAKKDVEEALARYENAVIQNIETSDARVKMFQTMKHLAVSGNGLVFNQDDGNTRLYALDQYVIKRDASGNVLAHIAMDRVAPIALDEATQAALQGKVEPDQMAEDHKLYTGVAWDGKKWRVWQEVADTVIPRSRGTYTKKNNPWLPIRLEAIDGEDYGRGYVENFIGDLQSAEGLSEAIVEGARNAAKVIWMVSQNGFTRIEDLVKAPNGGFVSGSPDDVQALQLQKSTDFNTAFQALQGIAADLSRAFLMNTSVQRPGERVTAEEIRFVAQELEDALGGVYSVLAQELQLPFLKYRIMRLEKHKKLPKLPDSVNPTITTGLQALGRGHDLERLRVLVGQIAQLGPEVVDKHVNMGGLIGQLAAALNVEPKGLINDPQDIEQQEQQQQLMAMLQQAMPGIMSMADNQLTNAQNAQGDAQQ